MNLHEMLTSETNFNITIQKNDLLDFAKFMISETKNELEAEVIAAKAESYVPRLEACTFLQVDQSTLFRWAKRGYLVPTSIGGKRVYKKSDLQRILNGGGN